MAKSTIPLSHKLAVYYNKLPKIKLAHLDWKPSSIPHICQSNYPNQNSSLNKSHHRISYSEHLCSHASKLDVVYCFLINA